MLALFKHILLNERSFSIKSGKSHLHSRTEKFLHVHPGLADAESAIIVTLFWIVLLIASDFTAESEEVSGGSIGSFPAVLQGFA